ncbi:MAG TPA: dolichyl-phosphate-mannose-protein mannosyltransferase [Cyanobacteria bacterium UBA11159]|nr:dolichyl-phosphate-mannose-protein mannosyltransferase [Cyanobacteria bacterium UBA11166]HBR74146.1 dolichyl-phosphate-mannose-protein mannosyltransferase [Cyanobacteria bacterium UBA11159]HBS72570.1 dolichyl-phosphate-mannose-protein mannosyltransferase [Cyanobacteria bacterium UBA11153]HCA97478.1 dolichyl-phosphate-mannose-protein mannosyltransferase [Cyanobacteria bacterium UBA9226]
MWPKKLSLSSLVVILIVLGILFRFYNLDRKVYWYDETMTSMRVSGYTQTEVIQSAFTGNIITVKDFISQYQYPNSSKSINDTLNALAGNPEHSPLYYLMARWWLQLWGNSILMIRLLSVLIGLLALPCIYWLSWELFGLVSVSWVAVALLAISPFHVLYAQEAREYSLWTVTILFACAAFLRGIRVQSLPSWGLYGMSVGLALYSHPFSVFVLIGHGVYILYQVFFQGRGMERAGKKYPDGWGGYLFSLVLGVGLFVPWLVVVVSHFSRFVENTASVNLSREGFLPLFWGLNLSRIFVDVNQGSSPFSPLHYLCALLAGYSLYYLYCRGSIDGWVFIVTLIGVMGMALIGPDLILGGRRSSITRYGIPSYLGIQIAVAYLIGTKINSRLWRKWQYLAIALAISGIISSSVSAQFPVWWHKSPSKSRYNPQVAHILNQSHRPLVITDQIPGIIFSLSHLLHPNIHLQLLSKSSLPQIPNNFTNIFLYQPSPQLEEKIKQTYQLIPQPNTKSWLLKLTN